MEEEKNNVEQDPQKESKVFVWLSVVLGAILIAGIFFFMGQQKSETEKKPVTEAPVEQNPQKEPELNEKSCKSDSDCVPATCCHATDVVNKEFAPDCSDIMCTMSCETVLDCGQGKPVCNAGMCDIGTK